MTYRTFLVTEEVLKESDYDSDVDPPFVPANEDFEELDDDAIDADEVALLKTDFATEIDELCKMLGVPTIEPAEDPVQDGEKEKGKEEQPPPEKSGDADAEPANVAEKA